MGDFGISSIKSGYNSAAASLGRAADWLEEVGREAISAITDNEEPAGLAACSSDDLAQPEAPAEAGVHFDVPSSSADSWGMAADYVLRWYCGVAEPTPDQVSSAASGLLIANQEHINDNSDYFSQQCVTPREADHEIFRAFTDSVEIFIPTPTPEDICPLPPAPVVPPVTDAGVSQPDAGAAGDADVVEDGGEPDAEVDAGATPAPTRSHRPRHPHQPHNGTATPPTPPPTTAPPTTSQPVVPL